MHQLMFRLLANRLVIPTVHTQVHTLTDEDRGHRRMALEGSGVVARGFVGVRIGVYEVRLCIIITIHH